MSWHQAIIGNLFAIFLIGLGIHFLGKGPAVFRNPPSRIHFVRIYGIFFIILGLMLGFAQLFLEEPAQRLADLSDAATLRGEPAPYSLEDRRLAAIWAIFWILFLLVFLALATTAFLDAMGNRKRFKPRTRFPESQKGKSP